MCYYTFLFSSDQAGFKNGKENTLKFVTAIQSWKKQFVQKIFGFKQISNQYLLETPSISLWEYALI